MAEIRDIPASILASDGKELKTGILSLLQKKGGLLSKQDSYELSPMYWRLVSYAGYPYLLGHKKQQPGQKATKKFQVKGCSTDLEPPQRAYVSSHSNETFLCVQCGGTIRFLKAENRRQRDKWVSVIRSAIQEPTYTSSAVSTTSTDSAVSSDAPWQGDQRFPSVHGTADTQGKPAAVELRRNHTSPAGQFKPFANQHSVYSQDTVPDSAEHLAAQQNMRMNYTDYNFSPQSILSSAQSLESSEMSRPGSLRNLDIYTDNAQYNGLGAAGCDEKRHRPMNQTRNRTYRHSEPNLRAHSSQGNSDHIYNYAMNPEPEQYMELLSVDDESTVSYANNLSERKRVEFDMTYDDCTSSKPPPLPERDYINLTKEEAPRKSTKKKRAPLPPGSPSRLASSVVPNPPQPDDLMQREAVLQENLYIEQMDSIEREKTVVLERDVPRAPHNAPARQEERRVPLESESLREYIERFRSERFNSDGVNITIPKTDLSPDTIRLVCIGDQICVASLPGERLHARLHVDDVIVKVNAQTLPSIKFCYDLFRTTDGEEVQLLVKRVPHGVLSHVTLPANGDIASLGIKFGNSGQGNEVTEMQSSGIVAKSGNPSQSQSNGVTNGGIPVNWGLVEVNQTPIPLNCTSEDIAQQLRAAGCEMALVFLPMDILQVYRDRSDDGACANQEANC